VVKGYLRAFDSEYGQDILRNRGLNVDNMFIKGNLREDTRTPFVTPVRYFISALETRESKVIYNTAVSIDVSTGGLGILTNYPLKVGHILTFEDELNVNAIAAKSAVVKWSNKINGNKYRVGLKFLKE
jgi:hypothetical protein